MANGYVDIPTGFAVKPYLGAGLGGALLHQTVRADAAVLANSDSHALAYQFIGGAAVPIGPPSWTFTLDYRYLATTSPLFRDYNGFFYNSQYHSHSVILGLRWQL